MYVSQDSYLDRMHSPQDGHPFQHIADILKCLKNLSTASMCLTKMYLSEGEPGVCGMVISDS